MKQWINTVQCPVGGKVHYQKVYDGGTRSYFIERTKGEKPVLKVTIQSNENRKSKKSGKLSIFRI